MTLGKNLILLFSGALIAGSIILSKIGLNRSVLSKKSAALLSGTGAGIGILIFIFYGVSDGDLIGSLIVGIITAFVVGAAVIIPSKWWR